MNIVYVLISNERDVYLEYMIMSILSVKKYNPEATIHVLLDEDTKRTFTGKRKRIYSLGVNIISATVPICYDSKSRSRYLKTTLNRYFSEDFLYIDVDTIVCDDLNEISSYNITVGCVIDKHYVLTQHPLQKDIEGQARKNGYHACYCNKHFNSGVMWVKVGKESTQLFELWHELWKRALKKKTTQDQIALNEANYRLGGIITEINGVWNCQISSRTAGWQYVHNANIIHYFAGYGNHGAPYDLANKQLLMRVYDNPDNPLLVQILDDPKSAFRTVSYLMCNDVDMELWESTLFTLMRKICYKQGAMFNTVNRILDYMLFLRKKIMEKSKNRIIRIKKI